MLSGEENAIQSHFHTATGANVLTNGSLPPVRRAKNGFREDPRTTALSYSKRGQDKCCNLIIFTL